MPNCRDGHGYRRPRRKIPEANGSHFFLREGWELSTAIYKCLEDDRAGGILLWSDWERPACRTPRAGCEGDHAASPRGSIPTDVVWGHGTDWGTKAKPLAPHGRRLCCLSDVTGKPSITFMGFFTFRPDIPVGVPFTQKSHACCAIAQS